MTDIMEGGDKRDGGHGPVCTEEGRAKKQPKVDCHKMEPVELSIWSRQSNSWVVVPKKGQE